MIQNSILFICSSCNLSEVDYEGQVCYACQDIGHYDNDSELQYCYYCDEKQENCSCEEEEN